MIRNNDFKIKEYHVFEVLIDDAGKTEWKKLMTFFSLSRAVKYVRWRKLMVYNSDYRVVGEFDYEEI